MDFLYDLLWFCCKEVVGGWEISVVFAYKCGEGRFGLVVVGWPLWGCWRDCSNSVYVLVIAEC